MMQYKTEKRPAKVGEKILITDARYACGCYADGDIRTVSETRTGTVKVEEHSWVILHREYEVIIENGGEEMGGIIEKMQAEIEELKAKVGALEKRDNAKPFEFEASGSLTVLTPQARRDEIVAQAKADVAELIEHGKDGHLLANIGNTTYRESFYEVEFVVNEKKRAVVVLVRLTNGKGKVFSVKHKGIAKCAPDDCFNSHIGRAIALRRALGLEVPSEYLNVPQPTEVRVGDVVRFKKYGTNTYFQNTVASIDNDYLKLKLVEGGRTNFNARTDKIIDDSREDD